MKLFLIVLGSNIGERKSYIMNAIAELSIRAGEIEAVSSLYETRPEGFDSQHSFLNAAIALRSNLSPTEMIETTRNIEYALGSLTHRNPDGSYRDRTIDIDIIACDDIILQTEELTIPHPRMHLRRFVLDPLCEIAPQWIHPLLHESVTALRDKLTE